MEWPYWGCWAPFSAGGARPLVELRAHRRAEPGEEAHVRTGGGTGFARAVRHGVRIRLWGIRVFRRHRG